MLRKLAMRCRHVTLVEPAQRSEDGILRLRDAEVLEEISECSLPQRRDLPEQEPGTIIRLRMPEG